jgi:hypothetical protein
MSEGGEKRRRKKRNIDRKKDPSGEIGSSTLIPISTPPMTLSTIEYMDLKEKNSPSYPHSQLLFTADVVVREQKKRKFCV